MDHILPGTNILIHNFTMFGPWAPVAADTIIADENGLVMIKRKNPPYQDRWCLPGGFHELGETVEQTATREAREETGLDVKVQKLVGVYSTPNCDPRHQLISVCFWVIPRSDIKKAKGSDDAREARYMTWNEYDKLGKNGIGFDHAEI